MENSTCAGMPALASALALALALATLAAAPASAQTSQPANRARDVNPDSHLVLHFGQAPALGRSGQIRIYDAADQRLVDTLDLAIPAGPTQRTTAPQPPYLAAPYQYRLPRPTNADTRAGTPSAVTAPQAVAAAAAADATPYQLTIIGGFSDGFHFHPVIVHDNTATIYPHHNLLEYGKTYYVQIDDGVLTLQDDSFHGIQGDQGWRFSTKARAPRADADRLLVSADGKGDFNTVQGALDFVPDHPARRTTIFINNGDYEEIVYFHSKSNLTVQGQERDKVRIHYANNEAFNPHPSNIGTNELPGTFPSRRAAFAADNVQGIELLNLTLQTTLAGQAEGLLLNGSENIVSHVSVTGSGDALQVNGSAYLADVKVTGHGDTVLGRGPAFFRRCELHSQFAYMWIRNPAGNHGNVFLDCSFNTTGTAPTEFARSPSNKGKTYPHAEAVLINATLNGISAAGWGEFAGDSAGLHLREYNSRTADGKAADVSGRNPISRQLDGQRDAALIASYSDPAWVLGGWQPAMAPRILAQPQALRVKTGQPAAFSVSVAAAPDASYQWLRNGKPLMGATARTLAIARVSAGDAGKYSVTVSNRHGSASSEVVVLTVR